MKTEHRYLLYDLIAVMWMPTGRVVYEAADDFLSSPEELVWCHQRTCEEIRAAYDAVPLEESPPSEYFFPVACKGAWSRTFVAMMWPLTVLILVTGMVLWDALAILLPGVLAL